jgi:hypothetical protein
MQRGLTKWSRSRGVLVAAAAVAAGVFLALPAAGQGGPARRVIASSSANGFKVVVTAYRDDDSELPAATVKIAAFERDRGSWKQLGPSLCVGAQHAWFWKVVTGPRSLRDLSIASAGARPVTIRLLISPSIGWSQLYAFHVQDRSLIRG